MLLPDPLPFNVTDSKYSETLSRNGLTIWHWSSSWCLQGSIYHQGLCEWTGPHTSRCNQQIFLSVQPECLKTDSSLKQKICFLSLEMLSTSQSHLDHHHLAVFLFRYTQKVSLLKPWEKRRNTSVITRLVFIYTNISYTVSSVSLCVWCWGHCLPWLHAALWLLLKTPFCSQRKSLLWNVCLLCPWGVDMFIVDIFES